MRAPVMFCSLFENRTSTPVRRTASGDGKETAEHSLQTVNKPHAMR